MTTYDRPIPATLFVRLANGEEWEATPEDFTKFGLVARNDAYYTFRTTYVQALADADLCGDNADDGYSDPSYAETGPLRYLVENAIMFPHLLDHPEHEGWSAIADIERRLRANPAADVPASPTA